MDLESAFILRAKPFQNTSLILELIGDKSGRVSAIARGVKRKSSRTQGLFRPFAKVLVKLGGKGELKTINNIESVLNPYYLADTALYCGLYMNEISLKLLAKAEGAGRFFLSYEKTLAALAQDKVADLELKYFEYNLLKEIGLAFDLARDFNGSRIEPDSYYNLHINKGLIKADNNPPAISGKDLNDFKNRKELSDAALQSLKYFMRTMLNEALGGRPVKTRELLQDYLKLKNA